MSIRSIVLFFILWAVAAPVSAQSKSREVRLDSAQKRKLNTFLSNFSEAYVQPFQRRALTDSAMIAFGIRHRKINNPGQVETVPGNVGLRKIHASHIQSAAQWYFGSRIQRHHSVRIADYKNGYYFFKAGDGDPLPFAQVARFVDNGDGTFTAYTNEYSTLEADVHGTPAQWKRAGHEVWFRGKRKALLKFVGEGAQRRYILLAYSTN